MHLARVISLLRARTVPFGLRYYLHPQAYSWNPVYAPFIFKALLAVFISKATDAVVYFRQMTSRVQFDKIILKWLCLNTIIRERQHLIALQREWGGGVSIISPSQSMRQPDYVNNCANSARNTVRPYASNSTQYLHYISFLPEKKRCSYVSRQSHISEMTPCMPRALNNRHGYNEVNQTHSRANTKEHLLRVCIGGLDFLVTYILEL